MASDCVAYMRRFHDPFTGTTDPIRVVNVYSSARVCPAGTNATLLMLSCPAPVTEPPFAHEGVLPLDASTFPKLNVNVRGALSMSTASLVPLHTLTIALTPGCAAAYGLPSQDSA